MMAYLIAFVVVWSPSSLNRITQLSTGTTIFVFAYAQSIVSPMRGFINFLAYFYTWWYSPLHDISSNPGSSFNKSGMKNSGSVNSLLNRNEIKKSTSNNSFAEMKANMPSGKTLGRSGDLLKKPIEDFDLQEILDDLNDDEENPKPKKNHGNI